MVMYQLPDYVIITIAGLAAFSTIFLIMIVAVSTKIPYFFTQLKAAFKKKPMFIVHQLNHSMQIHVTKRKNGDENTLDLPAYLGAKYVPDSSAVESFGLLKAYHAFEKSALAHHPEYSAAITTFMRKMEESGLPPSLNTIDALFYAKLNPEEMICVPEYVKDTETGEIAKRYIPVQVTQEEYAKLIDIKKEVEQTVVENNLICYDKVQEFLQYAEFQNSQNLDEARSILYKKAVEESTNPNKAQDYIQLLFLMCFAGIVFVVILKAAGLL